MGINVCSSASTYRAVLRPSYIPYKRTYWFSLSSPHHGSGYGAGGFPAWGIPPGGGLVFEIEILSINGQAEL